MTPREPIDQLIDDAAARLTRGNPSDALRANVMARIAATKPSPFSAWRLVFAGGTVAAIALMGVLSFRASDGELISPGELVASSGSASPTQTAPSVVSHAPLAKADVNPTGALTPSSPRMSMARTTAAAGSGQLALAALQSDAQTFEFVPALEHPALITVNPLRQSSPLKAIDPIQLAPIVVAAIGDDDNQ